MEWICDHWVDLPVVGVAEAGKVCVGINRDGEA